MKKDRRRMQKARRVARQPDETKSVPTTAKPKSDVKVKGVKRRSGKLTRSMTKLVKKHQQQ
jgi:hypothetical protein